MKLIDIDRRAAAAIANARGGRRGAPPITNVLDVLSEKLRAEVIQDAEEALKAAGLLPAVEAILYALERVQTDADFRWHMLSTETHRLLVRAEAALCGEDEEVVMARRREWLRKHADPVGQLPKARKRIEQLERALEKAGITPPAPAPEGGGA